MHYLAASGLLSYLAEDDTKLKVMCASNELFVLFC